MDLKVTMGGREFPVLPLNLKGLRRLTKAGAMKSLSALGPDLKVTDLSDEHLAAVHLFTHVVLARGTPALTLDEVEDLIDVTNIGTVLATVIEGAGLSGKKEAAEGEAQSPKSSPMNDSANSSGSSPQS
jgi:hypothetical protein